MSNLPKTIASIYTILKSAEVPSVVFDYCQDRGVVLGYDEFKDTCRLVACRADVMLPTSKDMRHFHGLLVEAGRAYERRVEELENEGLSTSDAQAVVDAELKQRGQK